MLVVSCFCGSFWSFWSLTLSCAFCIKLEFLILIWRTLWILPNPHLLMTFPLIPFGYPSLALLLPQFLPGVMLYSCCSLGLEQSLQLFCHTWAFPHSVSCCEFPFLVLQLIISLHHPVQPEPNPELGVLFQFLFLTGLVILSWFRGRGIATCMRRLLQMYLLQVLLDKRV